MDEVDPEEFRQELITPRTEAASDLVFHKFLGDVRDPFLNPSDHILCLANRDIEFTEAVQVTLLDNDVSCDDCLYIMKSGGTDCNNCGSSIHIAIFKGTGHCSENCRKVLDEE